MKSTFAGREAESAVAKYLTAQGFKILDQNWKTRVCEIDVIAQKDKVVFFVEVKYRSNDAQGDGFDYITTKKLSQMRFSAALWVANHNWGGDYRLAAAAVSGPAKDQVEFLEVN